MTQALFYANDGKALRPRQYPTALQLKMMCPLQIHYLEPPVTTNSLDLCHAVNIHLIDVGHRCTVKNSVWIKKGITAQEFAQQIPSIFKFKADPQYRYVISQYVEQAVSRILADDDVISMINVRVDVLKCDLANTCAEIAEIYEDGGDGLSAVEVRTLAWDEQGWPSFKTYGFQMMTKGTTVASTLKMLPKCASPTLTIRSTTDMKKAYMIDGKDLLHMLIDHLARDRGWAKERPVIVVQLNSKKE